MPVGSFSKQLGYGYEDDNDQDPFPGAPMSSDNKPRILLMGLKRYLAKFNFFICFAYI